MPALLLTALLLPSPAPAADDPAAEPAPASGTVSSVYDGDTLTLSSGDKVRLKWVNTPELRPAEDYGIEAREAAKALCLERDATLSYGEVKRDGYGRLIAGVECEGQDLSVHLLEQGLGHVFIIPPDGRDPGPLLAAQQKAKDANRGIWSTERYKGDLHFTSFHANAAGDDRENVNGEYLRVANVSSQPVDLAGFKLTDLSGRSFDLPALLVPAGHTVKVHSGKGEHQKDPGEQLAVFLGSEGPIWNNKRDRATLYDRHGRVVDSRDHEVKGTPNK